MIKKQILILNMTLLAFASYVHAQPAGNVGNQGYLTDNTGNSSAIKAPSSGVCVRTTEWTPARAIVECDPELTTKPPAPKPVIAAAPAPKPVVAPPPPPPPKPTIQKFSLSTDALFDFDKAILKPAGTKKLDDLITELKGSQYDSIVATGHTDRLGSTDYNQRLSHRRAEAVQKYLVAQGLNAAKINAVGKGKSQPVTKPADCKGKGGSALHACLQPDRRVDIEVSGSKTIQIPAKPVAKPASK
jgi:OOP family OmpA-OmpF porin